MAGLWAFAYVTILGILIVNTPFPVYVAVFGVIAIILISSGFELFRYAFSSADNKYRFFSRGLRGWLFDLAYMSLAAGLMVRSVTYQRVSDPLCGGRLGAGLPAAFVCDASGESPLSSVGKIDWADTDNISLLGSFLDVVAYIGLMWAVWSLARRIFKAVRLFIKSR